MTPDLLRRPLAAFAGFLLLTSALVFLPATPAFAATLAVNDLGDAVSDLVPGDGTCDGGAGVCTLRAAIQEANALAGADIITLPAGSVTLAAGGTTEDASADGDLDITDAVTINGDGGGSTVTGGTERVFHVVSGSLTLNDVTVSGGSDARGGGLLVTAGASATVNTSTFSGNGSTTDGGALASEGTLTVTNSTISSNTAAVGPGGGVLAAGTGTVTLTSTTVTANTSSVDGQGIANLGSGVFTIGHTIVGANGGGPGNNDCSGTITSADFNVVAAADGGTCTLAAGGSDVIGTTVAEENPLLDALASNGGPTQTHALQAGSPALNIGGACAALDQRGFNRGTTCDAGAYDAIQVNFVLASDATGESTDPSIGVQIDGGGGDVSVTITDAGTGDAVTPADFSLVSSTVGFTAGEVSGTTKPVDLTVNNDGLVELDETIDLELTAITGGLLGAAVTHTHTITDDEALPTVDFAGSAPTVVEGVSADVDVTLTLNGGATGLGTNVAVTVDDPGGTASLGLDYPAFAPATVTFTPTGPLTETLTIATTDDDLVESGPPETIGLLLTASPGPATIGTTTTDTVTITDNDSAGFFVDPTSLTVTEGAAGQDFTIELTSQPTVGVGVDFIVGSEITVSPVNVAFTTSDWDQPQTVTVTAVNDAVADGTTADAVTYTVTTTDPDYTSLVPPTVAVTVLDNELPDVAVVATDAAAAEPSGDSGEFTITRTGSTAGILTVTYGVTGDAVSGVDFDALSGTVDIPDGSASVTVPVTVIDDPNDEAAETVVLTLIDGAAYNLGGSSSDTVTITDDDLPPTLTVANVSIAEGDAGTSTLTFTLSLGVASGQATSVQVATLDGSATAGSDYVAVGSNTVDFPAGDTTKTVDVTINGDTTSEGDEDFTLELSVPSLLTLGTTSATGTIQDDDGLPTLTIDDISVTEGLTGPVAANFTVTLSAISGQTVTVNTATADDTATLADGDYSQLLPTLVTFDPGETTQTVTVDVLGDARDEGTSEQFFVNLTGASNATIADGQGVATIDDDDLPPDLSLNQPSVLENGGALDFDVSLSAPSGLTITVEVATTLLGSAAAGADFDPAGPTLVTFNPGDTSKTFSVTINDDTLDELDETVQATLSNENNAGVVARTRSGTILDNDDPPEISITNASVNETDPTATFTVTLSATSGQTVTVDAATADVSATAGEDYDAAGPTTLTFDPGETSKPFVVTITDDGASEGTETFEVNLSGESNATIGDGQGIGTILDDEGIPTLSIAGATVIEGDTPGTVNLVFDVTLTPVSGSSVSATWATSDVTTTAGEDYTVVSGGTVSFAPFDGAETVTVVVISDDIDENDETLEVTLTSPTGGAVLGTAVATGTITDDDDPPIVNLAAAPDSIDETGTLNFTVSLSEISSFDVTVDAETTGGTATPDVDYTAVTPPQQVTVPAGSPSVIFPVTILPDALDENNETVQVTISGAVNATLGVAVRSSAITDDDATPTIGWVTPGPTVGEAGTPMTFTVELSAPSGLNITVDAATTAGGGATPGADFTAITPTQLSILAGATSATFAVTINDDDIAEDPETVQVQLTNPSNATLGAAVRSGTINDNDTADVVVSPIVLTVVEGAAGLAYGVVLGSEPTVDVNVSVASSDPGEATVDTALLTFTPLDWDTEQFVTVTAVDDVVADGSVGITVDHVVTSGDGKYNGFVTDSVAVTVDDNESAPTLVISDVTVDENDAGGELVFLVTLTPASASTVTVDFATADVNATAGADYTAVAAGLPDGRLTFTPGATNRNARVPLLDDVFDEVDETLTVTLSNQSGGVTITDGTATGTITDNDGLPALSLNTPTASEAAGTLDFVVTLAPASGKTVTVTAETTEVGSATAGADFTAVSQLLTFTPGQTTKTVSVPITNDALNEGTEGVQMTLTGATNASIATVARTGDITDNDPLPTVSVVGDAGGEGAGTLVITVSLNAPSGRATNVTLNTANVTATAGSDYTAIVNRLVQFAAGETSKTITVDILEDDIDENAESFNAVLTAPTFATLGTSTAAVTINDNDTANVIVSETALTVAEGATGLPYTVILGSQPTGPVTVAIGVSDGQATTDETSLTFTAGNWSVAQAVTVTAVDDAVAEGTTTSTTITHTITSGDGNYNNFTAGSIAVTVTDNETTPTVNIANANVTEGPTAQLTYVVSLSGESAGEVQVTWSASAGSATAVDDFTPASGTVVFPPGALNRSAVVTVINDSLDEFDETVIVTLTGVTVGDATPGATTATGTIVDDDPEPTLSLNTPTATEADPNLNFIVTLSAPSGKTVTVTAETGAGGDATPGVDYTAVGPTVRTYTPGQTTKTIAVPIIDDSLDEPTEDVQMTLIGSTNAGIATAARLGTITDDDPQVGISAGNVSIVEGDTGTKTLTFTVSLSAVSGRNVAVDVETADITAEAGTDYVAVPSTRLQFAPGTTSLPVNVTVLGDVTAEGDETFELLLSNQANGTITTPSATGTIQDNEGPPVVNIAPATVEEGPGAQLAFLVTLSGESAETIQVTWSAAAGSATAGADFTAASGTLVFPTGAVNRNAFVTVLDDALDEFDETVTVTLTGITAGDATLGTSVETGTITDDDPEPALSLNTPTVDENAGPLVFTVTLSGPSGKTVEVTAATTAGGTATPGTDFVTRSALVTFNPGETSKTVGVSITDDGLDEPAETVQMALTNATNASIATAARSGTITDNDPPVAVSVTGLTVSEAAGSASVTISLSGPSGRNVGITAVTSNGSATAGADYTATSQTFTFAPGETSKTLVVPILNDVIDENTETFTVTLSGEANATIGTGTATVTITDNDTAGITVSPTALTVAEGAAGVAYSVVLLTQPAANVVVTVSLPGGEATASPGSLTFTPGNWDQPRNVTVTAVDDAVFDGDKSATASHTLNSGDLKYDGLSAASVAVTVDDNESPPTISIADAGVVEADASPVAMTFDVSISPASASDTTVDYLTTAGSATADVDYTQIPTTQLLIPAGATSATISVDVLPDNIAEAAETFTVTLTNASPGTGIGTSLATGIITDDDDAPNGVPDDYTVDEGGVLPTFNVLANDVDDDDTALTATVDTAPLYALVFSLAPDGSLTYEHDGSEAPTDTFTYRVSDGTNVSAATTVTITVTPVNDVPVVDAGGDVSVDEGDTVALPPATFVDPDPADTHTAAVDWGDGTALDPGTVDEGAETIDASHVYADNGTYTVSVDVLDSATPAGQGAASFEVTVANVAPTAVVAGVPTTSLEGTAISLTATADDPGTADTHTFVWSVTKDGGPYASGTTAAIDFTPDDEGTFVLTVVATDDDGADSPPLTATIDVTNVAPTVTPPADPTIAEGASFASAAAIADPGSLDIFTATVDWGEGAGPVAVTVGEGVPLDHVYVEDGTYLVTACVDDGTDETCEVFNINVNNVPAVIDGTATPATISEGDTVTLDVSFTDAGVTDTHTAVIDWGDGATTPLDPATSPFSLDHTYVDEGDDGFFTIVISITDDDGGLATREVVVTVTNSDLLVDADSAGESINEGESVAFSVDITDAGVTDTHTAVIDWGDGTADTDLGLVARTFDTGAHVFAQDGTYNVLITVTDNGGDVGTTSVSVTVANLAPVAAALTPVTIDEGTTFATAGTFSDPGTEDTFTGTVDYGDGSPVASLTLGAGTFDLSHPYADNGVFTVTVCITDEADATGCAAANVTVANVNPTASVSGPLSETPPFLEGTLLDFTAPAGDVPADPLTYAWSVELGDETLATGTGVNFTFTPPDNGVYNVTVVVSDDDGGSTTVSQPVTVVNVAPIGQILKVGGGLPLTTRNEGSLIELIASQTDPGADSFSYVWTVTKNGAPYRIGAYKTFTFRPNDEGQYIVELVITDDDGGSTGILSYELTALNVKPAPTILGTTGAVEGQTVTLSAEVNDPGPLDVAVYSWEVRLQGQLFASGTAPSLSFLPADNGVYFVSVVVSDDDPNDPSDDAVAGIGAQAVLVIVDNAAPVITSLNTNTAPVFGAPVTVAVNFTDSGANDLHTGQINWGDGSAVEALVITESNGSGATSATHVYPDRGSYSAEVCITDDDLGQVCETVVYAVGAVLNLSSDYNGDGRDDLAIGAPGETISGATNAGAVNVLFGRRIGIGSGPDDFIHQDDTNVPSVAQKNDEFGSAVASGDFNGDGFSDLAVSSQGETLGGSGRTGSVTVFQGSAAGISRNNIQWWHQGLPEIPGDQGTRDYFGATLATGDFNGDNFADLAIGVTGEDVGNATDAGRVVVLYGSPLGLAGPADSWDQNSPGVKNVAQAGDTFGASLTTGDFDRDGYWDLAIGVPFENINGQVNAGAVNVIRGSASGLISLNDAFLHQDADGVENVAEPNDNFGAAVAAGDFNGDGFVDLSIGVPGESYSGTVHAGAVAVLRGSATGLNGIKDQFFVAGNSQLPGSARANARFGASLAAADFTGNGKSDLAIGTPGDVVAGKNSAGSVTHLKGFAAGLTTRKAKRFTEASPGLEGEPFGNDQFGATLRAGNFDGDNDFDLAVGIPNQNVGGSANAGAVMVLRARRTGIITQADTVWNQNTNGVKDVAEAGDGFGRGL